MDVAAEFEMRVLGFKIHPCETEQLMGLFRDGVTQRRRRLVLYMNLHTAYLAMRDRALAALHRRQDANIFVDGMPFIWAGRLKGRALNHRHRQTLVDWLPVLFRTAAAEGWRICYVGSDPAVFAAGLARFRAEYPGLQLDGRDGFFSLEPEGREVKALVTTIRQQRPDILLVGMGSPRQEAFVQMMADVVDVPVLAVCGAAFEYFVGAAPMPPRWMGRAGLEWLFRLAGNPRRFARRYLVEPFVLAVMVSWRTVRGRVTTA
jgi:N-acetylglucosaminyldiphosphoundecaprenol N-acetyl-beta-D-mannosaminyltransferase